MKLWKTDGQYDEIDFGLRLSEKYWGKYKNIEIHPAEINKFEAEFGKKATQQYLTFILTLLERDLH
jgi:hypothetical protein